MKQLLRNLDVGNKNVGGLRHVTSGYGLLGFVKFLEGYYIILITKKHRVGSIGPHEVFAVDDTSIIALHQNPEINKDESRFRFAQRYSNPQATAHSLRWWT
jgi:phosphatidylinositol 3,5-bisphosphate 5-phosphatase